MKKPMASQSPPPSEDEPEEGSGDDISVKLEASEQPRLSRQTSQKALVRSAPLFDHYPDMTAEATSGFQVMADCTYSSKYLGSTEHAMDCDCLEEWGGFTPFILMACAYRRQSVLTIV